MAAAVRRGVRLFNRGRYFAANQFWEEAWRTAPSADRGFLEGLVQLAAGLHLRTRRGGTRGAVHLLSQALVTFEDCAQDEAQGKHGLDVARVIAEFAAYVDWLRQLGRPHRFVDRWRVPRIHAR